MRRQLPGAILPFLLLASAAAAQAVIPDPTLTPGAVRTTDVGAICSTPTSELRHWSRERDDRIMAEYGLPTGPHPAYEVDHLIPLCLGRAVGGQLRLSGPQKRRTISNTVFAKWYSTASSTRARRKG
jgi:hypothetical protein